jgi:ribosomal-protein-alanine N-acetyltransferase
VSGSRYYFLTTDRLGISYWNKSDLASAMMLWGDPRVSAWIGGPFTEEEVSARLEREIAMMSAHKIQYWPVFLLQNDEFAGCAGLRPYREDEYVLELGFHFRPDYWGQGLAQEAALAVIAFAFETLEAKSLFAGHHPANGASERLIKRLGFRFTHREYYPPTGLVEPNYLLANPRFL